MALFSCSSEQGQSKLEIMLCGQQGKFRVGDLFSSNGLPHVAYINALLDNEKLLNEYSKFQIEGFVTSSTGSPDDKPLSSDEIIVLTGEVIKFSPGYLEELFGGRVGYSHIVIIDDTKYLLLASFLGDDYERRTKNECELESAV